jgi:hypothetical protein
MSFEENIDVYFQSMTHVICEAWSLIHEYKLYNLTENFSTQLWIFEKQSVTCKI